jgi:predicted nucleic acid-binding protein
VKLILKLKAVLGTFENFMTQDELKEMREDETWEKDEIVLIDTSSWIEALRSSDRVEVRERVRGLLVNDLAAWCDMVAAELRNGARGDYEKRKLLEIEKQIICLPTTTEAWQLARSLAQRCRKAGHTVPSADLVIAACGLSHYVAIEHCDEHVDLIIKSA